MPLLPATRLGPYEVISAIGAGGMGEVYRAKDTRLDRIVAIKIIPEHLSANPQVRERFEREAHAIAGLSHPHICTLHDVGCQNGVDFLVMEYVEGETLASRLRKGPLPIDQVLRYATEIAAALYAAHCRGVIHRDLKPANIMLTKAGVKVLDFGLAKIRAVRSAAGTTALPTETSPLTGESTILGTLQYMAPEQLEGKEADARTDIFAFGVVLYEMATGRKAFQGKSTASLIAAIMQFEPPPVSTCERLTPPLLDRIVKDCLMKAPDDRCQSAHDLARELEWISSAGQTGAIKSATRRPLAWIVATTLPSLLAIVLGIAWLRRVPVVLEPQVTQFLIHAPEKNEFANDPRGTLAVSPDGRRLTFVAESVATRQSQLWVRSLDSLTPQVLTGTQGAVAPFWSPDGQWIGFNAERKLKKIPATGGSVRPLCDVLALGGGTWGSRGVILFESLGGLYRVPASGGSPSRVATADASRSEIAVGYPYFLPDGRRFLFMIQGGPSVSGAYVGALDSTPALRKRLFPNYTNAAYVPPGYLLFVRNGTLMAQVFDPNRTEISGEPLPVVEGLAGGITYFDVGDFSASSNGVLAYRRNQFFPVTQLVWFDRVGKRLGLVGPPGRYRGPWLAPDDKKVAVERVDQTGDIWVVDLGRAAWSRLTFDPDWDFMPVWSPDGSRIVFSAFRLNEGGGFTLHQKAATGTGAEERVFKSPGFGHVTDWSRDGRFILYDGEDDKTKVDVWILPLGGDRKPIPFLQTEFIETGAKFSPDSKWIAYASDETGRAEVYVQTFPASGSKWQVSTAGGMNPSWRRDGKELFFIGTDRKLMAVDVMIGPTFKSGIPRPLFETRTLAGDYAVTADGQRFLVNTIAEDQVAEPITVVLNWTAGLKR